MATVHKRIDANGAIVRTTMDKCKAELRAVGVTINYRPQYREYRVNLKDGNEGTAYYTNDLDDAMHTGHHLAKLDTWRKEQGTDDPEPHGETNTTLAGAETERIAAHDAEYTKDDDRALAESNDDDESPF